MTRRAEQAAANRAEVRGLVDAALAQTELRPDVSQASNCIRLLCAVFVLNGNSLNLRKGWVPEAQRHFEARGLRVPSGRVLRTYRAHLQENPFRFARTPMVDTVVLEAVERRYMR